MNALVMKSYASMAAVGVVVMKMVGSLDVASARDDENMSVCANNIDVGAVEARENRGRDHVFDGPESGLTAAQIKNAIKRREKLIQLMRGEHHRNASLATEASDEVDLVLLMLVVEIDQWLVEQQQLRRSKQRLRQQKELPLAAGHLAHRPVSKIARAGPGQGPVDRAPVSARQNRQSPALRVQRARNEIAAAHSQVGANRALLGQIPDSRIASQRRLAEDPHMSGARPEEAENRPHQCGLACTIGAEDADKFAGCDCNADVGQDNPARYLNGRAVEFNNGHGEALTTPSRRHRGYERP